MGSFGFLIEKHEADEDMARATRPMDVERVEALAVRLRMAVEDAEAFRKLYEEISADTTLSAQEVIAIAQRLSGGARPKSRKAALTAMAQERLRVSHALAKAASAAKARTW